MVLKLRESREVVWGMRMKVIVNVFFFVFFVHSGR